MNTSSTEILNQLGENHEHSYRVNALWRVEGVAEYQGRACYLLLAWGGLLRLSESDRI